MIDYDSEIERCLNIFKTSPFVMYDDFIDENIKIEFESSFGDSGLDNADLIANEMVKVGLIERDEDRCSLTRFGAQVLKSGGWLKHINNENMPNLDEILSEFMDVLAAHFPGGCRPFDFFNDKPYHYLRDSVIEKGTDANLIEWMGAAMKLSTQGYDMIQKHGSYLNYIENGGKHQRNSKYNEDEISEKLNKLSEGILRNEKGAEIIFDELQELKELVNKLSEKNWQQLLKGKLIDLAANKAVGLGFDVAKHIFKDLTGQPFDNLLK